ncbi:hypothetical protein BKP45_13485 [Anaerobacillus alkalidiazotrophicus]|uniref:Uncharacterized protein n=1 Tax=Anaerobacillus alkalidiazotrophicus TaxID=472963 RepID=A0A1S2M427_9BACI|nr:hypothetical protein [Anaerobacillus alkalidiazotrophicus]OIJ19451.1 hypothetical protein BKP45_13485 [Anaerobacillus alkalidiazotrophicus]
MTVEKLLIEKKYYEMIMLDQENDNLVQFLGNLYISEQNNKDADLSYIRFSQGEVYFQNKDYETAIFKWEKVHNHLEQWARKNMADAYYELSQFPKAIDLYKSVTSESLAINSEVALKLFSIYNEMEELDFAADIIKKAVSLNPDYPTLTEVARSFFEEYRDWSSAIELVVNEAIRTEDIQWFEVLNHYVEEGLNKPTPPDYFSKLLEVLYSLDQRCFEKLVVSLWNSYKDEEVYFSWLSEINRLFLRLEIDSTKTWHDLAANYYETYFNLISGQYLLKEIKDIVPDLLTIWLHVADDTYSIFAATSVLAWNESFKTSVSSNIVEKAEYILKNSSKETVNIDRSIELFEEITNWTKGLKLDIDQRLKYSVNKVKDLQTNYLLITGMQENGKTTVIKSLLSDNSGSSPAGTVVCYSNDKEIQLYEISSHSIHPVESFDELLEIKQEEKEEENTLQTSLIHVKMPNRFLEENQLTLINIPDFNDSTNEAMKHNKKEELTYVQFADGLLYVLTPTTLFTERDRELLLKLQEQLPNVSIHFLLKTDAIYHQEEVTKLVEETRTIISDSFPKAKIFPYSTHNKSSKQTDDLSGFIQGLFNYQSRTDVRNRKILFYIRETLTYLLKRRVETETQITEAIRWKEDVVSKVNAAVHQLSDLEKEKMDFMQRSYREIKDDIKMDLKMTIPKLLKECSTLIKEDSNFGNIHIELNEKMNERIHNYIEHSVLPKFSKGINTWIEKSTEEFSLSQDYLEEMSEGFNMMYGQLRFNLKCDFKVVDDWSRDALRISNGVQLETINILNRSTPSQLVMKGAGKVFGTLLPNKTMLCNMYKNLIEKEDYEKVAAAITNQFMLQFELFEKGLERDITMFFKEPYIDLQEVITNEQLDIQHKKERLQQLKSNPENYIDPITLFKVKLLQIEMMQEETNKSLFFA